MYNATKLRFALGQVRRWNSRLGLLHKKSGLLCYECNELKKVKTFLSLDEVAVLECGHRRAVQTSMTEQEQSALKKFVNSDEGRRAMQRRARVIGTEDDTDVDHNWRHSTLTIEESSVSA
jgi:hypothetical protein